MALTTNRKLTNEFVLEKKLILDVETKDFMHGRTLAIKSKSTISSLFENTSNFDLTDSKMEKKFYA